MKRSAWIVVVGLLTIVIGANGVLQGLVSLASTVHQSMDQSKLSSGREGNDGAGSSEASFPPSKEHPTRESAQQSDPSLGDKAFGLLAYWSADSNSWAISRTVVYLLIAGAYLIVGIALLTKPYGPRLFPGVMAVSIFWSLIQLLVYSKADSEMLLVVAPVFAPSVVIDVTLAAIVWTLTRAQPIEGTRKADPTSSSAEGISLATTVNRWIPKITGILAAIFALIFPVWILGVPGVENTYAQGWRMGLDVILYYPIAWVTVLGVSWLLKKAIPLDRQIALNMARSLFLLLFFSMALLRLGQAFSLIIT